MQPGWRPRTASPWRSQTGSSTISFEAHYSWFWVLHKGGPGQGGFELTTEWTFPSHGRIWLKVVVDPDSIRGYGGAAYPHLAMPFHLFGSSAGTPEHDAWSELRGRGMVWALGVDLFLPGSGQHDPIFGSGLQAHEVNSESVSIPVSATYVEAVSNSLGGQSEFVSLRMRVSVLVDPDLVANDLNHKPVLRSSVELVQIPVGRWHQTILPDVGFPTVRLVPLVLDLPQALRSDNEDANQRWRRALDELRAGISIFQSWHFEPRDLVAALRPVVEGALARWLTLWGRDAVQGKADEMIRTLNSAITPPNLPKDMKVCNAPQGIIPSSAPEKRLCVSLTMLHNLLQLSNVESHSQSRGTYSKADAESLLYMVTGVIRSLPGLWEQYPSPLS